MAEAGRRARAAMATATYPDEQTASAAVKALLTPYFRLFPQVWLEHYTGKRLRIDYVGVPLVPFPASLIGVEVKPGYTSFREYTRALKQARDYRHAVLIDKRATYSQGQVLPFVFVFPGMVTTGTYGAWAAGADRLAGLDNVGIISVERYQGVCLSISTERLWCASYGSRADALTWATNRKVGRQ